MTPRRDDHVSPPPKPLAADPVRGLRETLATLRTAPNACRSLQDVCDALSGLLGCQLVVLNLVSADGMRIVATSGPGAGHPRLGRLSQVDDWHRMLEASLRTGELRLCRDPRPFLAENPPDDDESQGLPPVADQHWGPLSVLIAPMWSFEGDLVGALTLEGAAGQLLPDELMLTVLEMFTAQVGAVICQQRLAELAAADHQALTLSEERYRLAFDNAPIGIAEFTTGPQGLLVGRINRAAARLFGVDALEARDRRVDEVFGVAEGEPLGRLMGSMLGEGHRSLRVELPFLRSDGSQFWGLMKAAMLPTAAGRGGIVCQVLDITESRTDAMALAERAQHDPLTGLANRFVVLNRLDDVVHRAGEEGTTGALLFCDLDNFKIVNDEQGHLAGDQVLAELAHRIGSVVRADDTASRFGGDEFVIVAYPASLTAATRLGDRVAEALAEPMVLNESVLQVTVSIGIAVITGAVEPAEVLRRADAAMYEVRSRQLRPTFVVDTA